MVPNLNGCIIRLNSAVETVSYFVNFMAEWRNTIASMLQKRTVWINRYSGRFFATTGCDAAEPVRTQGIGKDL